ncbi:TIGR02452 family protein [Actinocorallia sp. A-T 12471]|uniref:TIGR02452 family protein n=1 Tax=Actinocorallia sp. A-T 12471 TaxID=3089813 RepID=UPI0029CC4B5D|nr:TIGR02452 family protein [Actinocorallia sp. A-T 12471]MDX6744100.1 TIGR02452 family protein [Actinocorallia sp. A-T 12471]
MRLNRKAIAEETMAIIEAGSYRVAGRTVTLDVPRAVAAARLVHAHDAPRPETGERATVLRLTPETTLEAARRLGPGVAALNFASAKNPGGGFLRGAHAQEEALARASTLYPTLRRFQAEFYDAHRAAGDARYSDRMIYSPHVQVFRDESGALLTDPYEVAFITSPAPNRGALAPDVDVSGALRTRAAKVLALAAAEGHRTLVLGAWGCGVFRNDPGEVADVWADLLDNAYSSGPGARAFKGPTSSGRPRTAPFSGVFEHVTMAVWDPSGTTPQYRAFAERFKEAQGAG